MQRYVVILLLFLTTISSAMADTTDDLIQRVDSIMDNISQIYGKKQARIDFYKNMAEKSRKPETLLSATVRRVLRLSVRLGYGVRR